MEGYLLIILYTFLNLGESIVVKSYARRHGDGGMLMNAVISFFACAFFAITDSGGFYVPAEMIPLAVINAFLYAAGFYLTYVAFRIGPYGLTRLISSFSLMFSIFYGIFFLGEQTSAFTYIGLALIIAAMVLVNYSAKGKETEKPSLKWLVCIAVSVVANGFIAILTRMQQIQFNNLCSNEFQMISTAGAFLLLAVIGLITDREKLGKIGGHGILYGVGAGLFNGAKNFVTLAIYLFLPLSVISPTKTGLGMIVAYLTSVLFYKERYSLPQKIGVLAGTVAIVILAIS